MEVSDVRRRVVETIERAKQQSAARRGRATEAAAEYDRFIQKVALPIFRQVAQILRAESYAFTLFTPSGAVRLMSDRNSEDFLELFLDTSGEQPTVIGHAKRARGSRIVETEAPIGEGPIPELTEEQVLKFVLTALAPMVER